jgi:GDPmannose 4,6-dehydratase
MSAARRALVIGAAGQDGSYLTELLVEKGYDVTGVIRRDPADRIPNLDGVRDRIALVQADLGDAPRLEQAIRDFEPDEIYNLASVSFGPDAWSDPVLTAQLGTVALTALLEAIRASRVPARFFQASSAWVFGQPEHSPQNEQTPYAPSEPYGAAKAFGDFLVRAYRARYDQFACSALFYNHESPRRPERFVTRKITRAAAAIKLGLQSEVVLGDIDAARDWGYAKDFVAAVWAMLQADEPEDYVIATGEPHTVRELIELAFSHVGLDWEEHVTFNPALRRGGGQVANLVGDSSKLRERLGWKPTVTFEELVRLMVDADLDELSRNSDG